MVIINFKAIHDLQVLTDLISILLFYKMISFTHFITD